MGLIYIYIYIDACLVIYLVEGHAQWNEPVVRAVIDASNQRFGISPLVKYECLVAPIKRADPVMERAYTELFSQFVQLAMPEPVYLLAAQLRARFGIRTLDALHLACAQHHECEALWTNDDRLAQASRGWRSIFRGWWIVHRTSARSVLPIEGGCGPYPCAGGAALALLAKIIAIRHCPGTAHFR